LVIANITLKYFFQIDVVVLVDVVDVHKKVFGYRHMPPLEITSIFSSEYPGARVDNIPKTHGMLHKYRILFIIGPIADNNNENLGFF
jgi:hypothetical protein